MFLKKKLYGQSSALAKHSLPDVYNTFKADFKDTQDDAGNSPADLWGEIAPLGNIYRVNAMHTEHLKHQADLQEQLQHLANEFADALDEPDQAASIASMAPSRSVGISERRTAKLVGELANAGYCEVSLNHSMKFKDGPRQTWVKDQDEDVEGGAMGYPPLCEFLCPEGVERHLGGLLLLPKGHEAKRQATKTKAFALLIASIQVLGPFMIFVRNWELDTNHFKDGHFFGRVSWAEFTCLGSWEDTMCTVMGTLFLVLILEVCRNYAQDEIENCRKTRRLPMDGFWSQLGQLTNMTTIFFTAMSMPVLFWSEMTPKDIVFDALGLLFIFTLDDLAGDACGFLGLNDEGFQQLNAWVFALLTRCPVHLREVTNSQAKTSSEIWQIRSSPAGLLSAETGEQCKCRIGAFSDSRTPLAGSDDDSVFKASKFEYWVSSRGPASHLPSESWGSAIFEKMWIGLHFLLGVLEVFFPLVFFTLNKPCLGKETDI